MTTEDTTRCRGNDPACPCQDGDVCHYADDPKTSTAAWPIPNEAQRVTTSEDTTAAEVQWVVLRRADAEALIEEHALEDDPFWRPVSGVAVMLPPCSCGSISLYAENPPRLGHHHQASCLRWRDRQTFRPAVRFSGLSEG